MIKIDRAVIVEGKYDKIKLSSIIDSLIITTDGFSIFKDREKMNFIRHLAETKGIVILTDSDSAGFMIRSHIIGSIKNGNIINAYIPDVLGKEKRKACPSKEGKLGVEGIEKEMILSALEKAGVFYEETEQTQTQKITKFDLFEDGICGAENSFEKRKMLLKLLSLPEQMSANMMLQVLNSLYSYDEYKNIIARNF